MDKRIKLISNIRDQLGDCCACGMDPDIVLILLDELEDSIEQNVETL